jgi:hypothetical protein
MFSPVSNCFIVASSYSPHAILNVRTWIAYTISWRPPVDRPRFRCNFTLKTSNFYCCNCGLHWNCTCSVPNMKPQRFNWIDVAKNTKFDNYDNQISILGLHVVWLRVDRVVLVFFRSFQCQKNLNEASATKQCQPRCPNSWAELWRSLRNCSWLPYCRAGDSLDTRLSGVHNLSSTGHVWPKIEIIFVFKTSNNASYISPQL